VPEGVAVEARPGAPRDAEAAPTKPGLHEPERPTRRELLFLWLLASGLGISFGSGLAAAVALIRPAVFFGLLLLGLLALAAGYLAAGGLDDPL
jgi:hypothetical protein